jgi:hypothetical protein
MSKNPEVVFCLLASADSAGNSKLLALMLEHKDLFARPRDKATLYALSYLPYEKLDVWRKGLLISGQYLLYHN